MGVCDGCYALSNECTCGPEDGCTCPPGESVRSRLITASRALAAAQTARDAEIISAAEHGWTYGAIGHVIGMSRQGVHQVIKRSA